MARQEEDDHKRKKRREERCGQLKLGHSLSLFLSFSSPSLFLHLSFLFFPLSLFSLSFLSLYLFLSFSLFFGPKKVGLFSRKAKPLAKERKTQSAE
jgi:hypothetical protein